MIQYEDITLDYSSFGKSKHLSIALWRELSRHPTPPPSPTLSGLGSEPAFFLAKTSNDPSIKKKDIEYG